VRQRLGPFFRALAVAFFLSGFLLSALFVAGFPVALTSLELSVLFVFWENGADPLEPFADIAQNGEVLDKKQHINIFCMPRIQEHHTQNYRKLKELRL